MRSLAQLVDDGLDLLAGRRFDPDLIGGNVIDLGHHRERVTALADRLNAHRSGRPKQAVVLWTSGYSAVTKRGPWVYIARGLVDALSDDAVAFVLAHEMGHHDLRHLSPTVMIAGLLGELLLDAASDLEGHEAAPDLGEGQGGHGDEGEATYRRVGHPDHHKR